MPALQPPINGNVDLNAISAALTLRPNTLQLEGRAAVVDVSDIECCLLSALAAAPQQRLRTVQLLEIAGRNSIEPTKSTLEVQIVRLRKKLEKAGAHPPCIKVIRGTGYQLCVHLSVTNPFTAPSHA
jgi:DNA-binding response OmpR family regulator